MVDQGISNHDSYRASRASSPSTCMVVSNDIIEDPRVLKEALTLSRAGFRVFVWTWHRGSRIKEASWGGHPINPVCIPAPQGISIRTLALFPLFWFATALRVLLLRPSVIHCHDFDTLPVGFALRMLTNAKVVFDAHEIYSEMVKGSLPGILARIISLFESKAVESADLLILPDAGRVVLYPETVRITVVPNTPSVAYARAPIENPESEIFYGGALARDKGILELIEAVSSLKGICLTLAGHGALEDFIIRKSEKSESVKFLGVISRKMLFERLWRSLATVVFYEPSNLNNIYAASNKMYEAMMLGVPVITNFGCSCEKTVEREECGLLVRYGDVEALATALRKLVQDSSFRLSLARKGYAAFVARHAWERYEPDLIRSYDKLIAGTTSSAT